MWVGPPSKWGEGCNQLTLAFFHNVPEMIDHPQISIIALGPNWTLKLVNCSVIWLKLVSEGNVFFIVGLNLST